MNKRARLVTLIAAAAALWFARNALMAPGPTTADTPRLRAALRVGGAVVTELCSTPGALPARGRFGTAFGKNPFDASRPVAKAPVRPVLVLAGPPLPPPPPPPAPPPHLPYRYLGGLNENGQAASVYLGLGDKLIQAKAGDTLEGGYRLESIAARELTFLNLQHNLTLRLRVDGEPS